MKNFFRRAVLTALILTAAGLAATAQSKFTFNLGGQVYTIRLDSCYEHKGANCAGGSQSGSGPAGSITAIISLDEANNFTLEIPELKIEYKGTYVETTAVQKRAGLTVRTYAVQHWENRAQRKDFEKVRSELLWVSTHPLFLFVPDDGTKLYVTYEAEATIKKMGLLLTTTPFNLSAGNELLVSFKNYGPTIIVECDKGLQIRSIDADGNEAVIAVKKDGSLRLLS